MKKHDKRFICSYAEFTSVGKAVKANTEIHNLNQGEVLSFMLGTLYKFCKDNNIDIDDVIKCLRVGEFLGF